MSERTRGEWTVTSDDGSAAQSSEATEIVETEDEHIAFVFETNNADFIALAGTIANRLDSLGFDGQACIERLPAMLNAMSTLLNLHDEGVPINEPWDVTFESVRTLLAALKPKGAP
jgi:hypothetical protein